jgi:hypothetical protein
MTSLSSLNSLSPEVSSLSSSEPTGKDTFSYFNPGTWSMFKKESCEVKRKKTMDKAQADYATCSSKEKGNTTQQGSSSGSILSYLGFGSTPAAAPAAPKVGGRKKTQKKQKKQRKSKKRRTLEQKC